MLEKISCHQYSIVGILKNSPSVYLGPKAKNWCHFSLQTKMSFVYIYGKYVYQLLLRTGFSPRLFIIRFSPLPWNWLFSWRNISLFLNYFTLFSCSSLRFWLHIFYIYSGQMYIGYQLVSSQQLMYIPFFLKDWKSM